MIKEPNLVTHVLFLCYFVLYADAKFKQFRGKGIELKVKSKMDKLSGGHAAWGNDMTTPNIDPFPTPMEKDKDRVSTPNPKLKIL